MASSFQNRLIRIFTGIHVFLYRISGGKIWGKMGGNSVLMLTTTGRKTGKLRTTPVVFTHQNNEYLIAASAGGADKNPTWLTNLQSNPQASILIDGSKIDVKAVIASGEERDQLYELFKAMGPGFIEYENRTTRKIPVVRLQPATS